MHKTGIVIAFFEDQPERESGWSRQFRIIILPPLAGRQALTGLMRTFVSLGGIFMQIDVADTEMLRDAQHHPEKYPNLSVRISGWSARFSTLTEQWQEMIIARTEQQF